jgi:hypothetical protein
MPWALAWLIRAILAHRKHQPTSGTFSVPGGSDDATIPPSHSHIMHGDDDVTVPPTRETARTIAPQRESAAPTIPPRMGMVPRHEGIFHLPQGTKTWDGSPFEIRDGHDAVAIAKDHLKRTVITCLSGTAHYNDMPISDSGLIMGKTGILLIGSLRISYSLS